MSNHPCPHPQCQKNLSLISQNYQHNSINSEDTRSKSNHNNHIHDHHQQHAHLPSKLGLVLDWHSRHPHQPSVVVGRVAQNHHSLDSPLPLSFTFLDPFIPLYNTNHLHRSPHVKSTHPHTNYSPSLYNHSLQFSSHSTCIFVLFTLHSQRSFLRTKNWHQRHLVISPIHPHRLLLGSDSVISFTDAVVQNKFATQDTKDSRLEVLAARNAASSRSPTDRSKIPTQKKIQDNNMNDPTSSSPSMSKISAGVLEAPGVHPLSPNPLPLSTVATRTPQTPQAPQAQAQASVQTQAKAQAQAQAQVQARPRNLTPTPTHTTPENLSSQTIMKLALKTAHRVIIIDAESLIYYAANDPVCKKFADKRRELHYRIAVLHRLVSDQDFQDVSAMLLVFGKECRNYYVEQLATIARFWGIHVFVNLDCDAEQVVATLVNELNNPPKGSSESKISISLLSNKQLFLQFLHSRIDRLVYPETDSKDSKQILSYMNQELASEYYGKLPLHRQPDWLALQSVCLPEEENPEKAIKIIEKYNSLKQLIGRATAAESAGSIRKHPKLFHDVCKNLKRLRNEYKAYDLHSRISIQLSYLPRYDIHDFNPYYFLRFCYDSCRLSLDNFNLIFGTEFSDKVLKITCPQPNLTSSTYAKLHASSSSTLQKHDLLDLSHYLQPSSSPHNKQRIVHSVQKKLQEFSSFVETESYSAILDKIRDGESPSIQYPAKVPVADVFVLDIVPYLVRNLLSMKAGIALYSLTNTLLLLLQNHFKLAPVIVVFDLSCTKSTYHAKPHPDWKSNLKYLKKLVCCMGFRVIETYEISRVNVIGSLTRNLRARNYKVSILSMEQAMYQLLSDQNVHILEYRAKIWRSKSRQDFCDEFGALDPRLWPDVLALSIAHGIGRFRAIQLLNKYRSLDHLLGIASLNYNSRPQFFNAIHDARDKILKFYKAYRFENSIKVDDSFTEDSIVRLPVDLKGLGDLFYELDFHENTIFRCQELAPKIFVLDENNPDNNDLTALFSSGHEQETNVNVITSGSSSYKEFEQLRNAIDTISIVSYTVVYGTDGIAAIAISTGCDTLFADVDDPDKFQVILSVMSCPTITKIGWDVKHDYRALKQNLNVTLEGSLFDISSMQYLIDYESNISIRSIFTFHLADENFQFCIEVPKSKNDAIMSCECAFKVYHKMNYKFIYQSMKESLATELGLVSVIAKMEMRGIQLRENALVDYQESLKNDLESIKEQIFRENDGKPFNLNPSLDAGKYVSETLGFGDPTYGSKKNVGTKEFLFDLAQNSWNNKHRKQLLLMIDYRKKLGALPKKIQAIDQVMDKSNNLLFIKITQNSSVNGCMSVDSPIILEDWMPYIIPRPGLQLLFIQLEYVHTVILASFSKDERLNFLLKSKRDIYKEIASCLLNRRPTGLETAADEHMVAIAKAVHEHFMYGYTMKRTCEENMVSKNDVTPWVKVYKEAFPNVVEYHDKVCSAAKASGSASSFFGKRYEIKKFHFTNMTYRRISMKFAIEGTAGDMMKLVTKKLAARIARKSPESHILAPYQHGLIFETRAQHVVEIERAMTQEFKMALELEGDCSFRIKSGTGQSLNEVLSNMKNLE